MKLGDKIELHIERKGLFKDFKPDITDGEFIVIEISTSLAHCFSDNCYTNGFNHFDYAERQDNRPDVVRRGSVYVPTPEILDSNVMEDLHYDNKVTSWKVLDK